MSNIDQAVLEFFTSWRPHALSEVVAWFSEISRPAYVLVITLLVAAVSAAKGQYKTVMVPVAVGLTNLLVHILKPLIDRPRPDREYQLVYEFSAAMPSGHAAGAIALAVIVSLLKPRLGVVVAIWAVLVALSRLYLGVHWLSDVLVGGLLGTTVAYLVWLTMRRMFHNKN